MSFNPIKFSLKFSMFLLGATSTFLLNAQKNDLVLKSFVKDGKVYLRWAPSTVQLFESGLKNGYVIKKYTGTAQPGAEWIKTEEIKLKPVFEHLDSLHKAGKKILSELIVADGFKNGKFKEGEKQQVFAYTLLNAGFNINSAKENGLYYSEQAASISFKITIAGTSYKSNLVTIDPGQNSVLKPILLDSILRDKKRPLLSWEAASRIGDYSAYWIERSTDNIKFQKIGKSPVLFLKSQFEKNKTTCVVLDTNAAHGQMYYYRIVGVNHFGMEMNVSNTRQIYIPNDFNPLVKIDTIITNKNNKTIRTSFLFGKKDEIKYGKELILQVSNDEKKFTTISALPFDSKLSYDFSDNTQRNRINYRVGIISIDNDTIFSYSHYYFVPDADPPATPENLSGIIDKNGVVKLTWNANTEADFKGYKIYRANNLKEEFIERTTKFCMDPNFIDTVDLNNLDSLIYYKVIAVDMNYNHSMPSLPLKLAKPDKIAPVAVVIRSVYGKENGLLIKWNYSSSADVKFTKLWRIKNGSPKLYMTFKAGDTTSVLLDTGVVAGNFYEYKFEVVDRSGNSSESKSGQHKFEPGFRASLQEFKAIADIKNHQIKLSWKEPLERVHAYQVYRIKNKGQITLLKTIEPVNASYIDTELNINNIYKYAVKAIFLNGVHSKMTEMVEVIY
jgi:hypothetical protein